MTMTHPLRLKREKMYYISWEALLGHVGHHIELENPDGGTTIEIRCRTKECETEEPLVEITTSQPTEAELGPSAITACPIHEHCDGHN